MNSRFRLSVLVQLSLLLILLAANVFATDKVLDASQIDKEPASLTEYFAILEDPSTALTLADVQTPEVAARFKGDQAPAPALNYGFTRSAYWLRLTVRNTADHPVERLLEISYARLGKVQFHQPGRDGVAQSVTTGFLMPFATRPYPNRFFVFPLTLPAHTEQVYHLHIRQQAPSLQIPAKLWAPPAFHEHEIKDYLGQAWYFGTATAMILFNLLLFISLRDSLYLLYVAFVACLALASAAEGGLGGQFFWLDSPRWAEPSPLVLYLLSLLTFLPFMRRMLNTAKVMPKFDRAINLLWGISLVLLIGVSFSYQMFAKPILLVLVMAMPTAICAGVLGAFQRERSAYFFLTAFGALTLVAALNGLRNLGLLTYAVPGASLTQFGSAIEMMVLAFALADRYNQLRQEKAKAQRETIQAQAETVKSQAETLQAQTEKMTSLTQLVTNVAHEINTPIGAVKSSGDSISTALDEALTNLPRLFEILDAQARGLFTQLVSQAKVLTQALTTREERALKNQVAQQLEAAGVEDADRKAKILVKLRAQATPLDYLPLLTHPESDFILDTAQSIGAIINSTKNIHTAVDRVSKIVTTLKSFSQADILGEMTDANLKDGIESVLAIYYNQIKQNTELVRQYEEVPPLRCLPDELTQVWTHLIHNALQAMGYKGKLTIALKRIGNEAVVSVTDTGSGIPDEIRGRIFEPFFSTRPQGEGAGLGLDIVKKIVEKHKGRIDVQTEVGVGSTFSVFLPYLVATEAA